MLGGEESVVPSTLILFIYNSWTFQSWHGKNNLYITSIMQKLVSFAILIKTEGSKINPNKINAFKYYFNKDNQ